MSKNLTITIQNEEEYQNFLKALPKYRGIFYRNVRFSINGELHHERLKDFEEALNIKKRRDRIRFLYDRCCDIVDDHNSRLGIVCHFCDGVCEDPKHQKYKNGCCFLCYLQNPKGCPSKNLSCKFFFCDHIAKKYQPMKMEDLDLLRMFTWSQREIINTNYYVSMEEHLKMLNIGSYLLLCMYTPLVVRRSVKNLKTNAQKVSQNPKD